MKDVQRQSRLVVTETVYHAGPDGQHLSVGKPFSRKLSSDEEPYQRTVVVGPEWQALDSGWLNAAGMVVIENDEGRNLQRQPTKEQRQEMDARVVEVASGESPAGVWLVRPTESFRGEPDGLASLRLRCRSGTARCRITLLPT